MKWLSWTHDPPGPTPLPNPEVPLNNERVKVNMLLEKTVDSELVS